jgi:multiple sugar transport system substrate-binding protein
MKRKTLVIIATTAAGLIAVAVFTAVSVAKSNKTITITAWVRDYTLDQASPYKTAAAAFEKLHPNVKIKLSGVPYDAQYQRIVLSKAGGPQADIMQVDTIWLGQMATQGFAGNLDSQYAKWRGKSDIPTRYLKSSKWKGHYYGVWLNTDVRILLWNKQIFRKAGLNPNKPPRTWAQMVSMAKVIQAKEPGVWGVGFPAQAEEATADLTYPLIWMGGGDVLNKNWTKAAFNSPAGVRAVQWESDLVNKYKVTPKDVLTQNSDDIGNGIDAGRYAMEPTFGGTGYGSFPDANTPAKFRAKFGNALPPLCPGCKPASGSGGWLLIVNKKSKYRDLAFQYMTMVTNGKNSLPFDIASGVTPVRKSITSKYKVLPGYPYFGVSTRAIKVTHFAPYVPPYEKIVTQIYTAIQKAVAGNATPKQALDQAAANTNKILAGG